MLEEVVESGQVEFVGHKDEPGRFVVHNIPRKKRKIQHKGIEHHPNTRFLHFDIRDGSDKKVKSRAEAEEQKKDLSQRIGSFYSQVVLNILDENGYAMPEKIRKTLLTGEEREVQIDLLQETLFGDKMIEVKAITRKEAQPPCKKKQIENYTYQLLENLSMGKQRPVLRYAFTRYGPNDENLHLGKLSDVDAYKKLASQPADYLVVPTNLAMLLFKLSRIGFLTDETDNKAPAFMISGNLISLLHNPSFSQNGKFNVNAFLDAYEPLLEKTLKGQGNRKKNPYDDRKKRKVREQYRLARLYANRPTMHLGKKDIRASFRMSDERRGETSPIACGDTILPSSRVAIYSIKYYDSWIKDFRKYHKIALNALGVRDLWAEEAPYRGKKRYVQTELTPVQDSPTTADGGEDIVPF
jgi:hypothetical protein